MSAERSGSIWWEGDAYAPQAGHHRSFDDWFLARHPPQPDAEVVDAGCGTGEFTAKVAEMVPNGRVTGVEPDPSMLATARAATAANVEFRQGALQELDRVCEPRSADLVLSRAVFHWIPLTDYLACYRAILQVLKPGGWLHAESGGAGNVAGLVEVLDGIAAGHGLGPAHPTFPDAGRAFELVEQAGFGIPEEGVITVAQRRTFDRDHLRGFLRTQACLPYLAQAAGEVGEAFLADVDDQLGEFRRHDGSYDQTFVRLVVRCRRPE